MTVTSQIAKHLRDVHFGGNWTWSNVKDNLAGVTWQQATTKVESFNTIAVLTFHINYFVEAISRVLDGQPINAHDKFGFDHPPIHSEEDRQKMVEKTLREGEYLASQIEKLPDSILFETFVEEKYGTYYRNFNGLIEHTHYHLGQVALVKKLVQKP